MNSTLSRKKNKRHLFAPKQHEIRNLFEVIRPVKHCIFECSSPAMAEYRHYRGSSTNNKHNFFEFIIKENVIFRNCDVTKKKITYQRSISKYLWRIND